jgi:A/G-specific adenine glycosylase
VVEQYDGIIPSDPEQLQALPGVGRYTAGAVASFAYERATPVVDTNVARVLQRAFHPRIKVSAPHRRLWDTARRLTPTRGKTAWSFNQALMELGALVCTARMAKCEMCPVRQACKTGRLTSPRPRGPARQRRGRPRRSR